MTRLASIVWAEDSGADQMLVQGVLDELDPPVDVAFASDGEEAVRLAAQHRPGLVVLDLRMPRLDGLGALRRLRGDGATAAIPVLVFSSATPPADVAAARALGVLGCIEKPMDFNGFRRAVRGIVAHAARRPGPAVLA